MPSGAPGIVELFKDLEAGERFLIQDDDWDVTREKTGYCQMAEDLRVSQEGCDTAGHIVDMLVCVISPVLQASVGLRLKYLGAEDAHGNSMPEFASDYLVQVPNYDRDSFGHFIVVVEKATS